MDTKILIIVVAVLVGFFAYQKCTEKNAPTYDEIQNEEFSKKKAKHEIEKSALAEKLRQELQQTAEKARGNRPKEEFAVLETADIKATFTSRGGSLYSYTLKNAQYLEPPRDPKTGEQMKDSENLVHMNLVTTNLNNNEELSGLRFNVYEGLDSLLGKSDYSIVTRSRDMVLFKLSQPGLPVDIYKKFEIDEKSPFQIWLTIRVDNIGDEPVAFRAGISQHGYQSEEDASAGGMFSQQPNQLQGVCRYGDTLFTMPWNDEDFGENGIFHGTLGRTSFTGIHTNYFLSAMIPSEGLAAECRLERRLGHYRDPKSGKELNWGEVVADLTFKDEIKLKPGQQRIFKVKSYMGPKQYRQLRSVGYHLETSVDFGMLAPICRVLLSILFFFQNYVVNWGIAIILLTIVVKLALMPLTHKSFQSAEKMKSLKPEVDKINERYKDDPQTKQKEIMALYKERKVNPLGGCIPSLLQMPIWIALFSTLRTSPELYRAPFFGWIKDLSNPDPYFVTPIVMGLLMFVQQKFTPMTGDSAQAKMMLYFMPIMFTAMMLFLPSGLTLYILVNTVLSIGHQMIIHKRSSQQAGA